MNFQISLMRDGTLRIPQIKDNKIYKYSFKASLTVEASLVLPVLVFAVTGLLYLIQIMNIEEKLQFGITQVAWEASEYGFIYNDISKNNNDISENNSAGKGKDTPSAIRQLGDGTFYGLSMRKYVDSDYIDNSCVLGGYSGLSFYGSRFMEDGETIRVVISYRVKIPGPLFPFLSFPVLQKVESRAFIGDMGDSSGKGLTKEEGDGDDENGQVFITETGTKYHKSKDCTYLKPQIVSVAANEVESRRNPSGEIYYACEKCGGGKGEGSILYITKEGNRYHSTLSCSGLKRTVSAVTLKEARSMGRTSCSKCGK